jgi:hypothetical protein
VLNQVFLQRPEPEEALLDVFNVIYTSKPGGERDSWADLILAGHFKGAISVDALSALVGSVAITFQICDRVIKNHTDVCTAARVARLIQALPLRGNGIPMAVSEPALCDYLFRRDATAQQLTLLSHAPRCVGAQCKNSSQPRSKPHRYHVYVLMCSEGVSRLNLSLSSTIAWAGIVCTRKGGSGWLDVLFLV